MTDYSQQKEQEIIARFFEETGASYSRFFVDVGAFDGVTGSNSRFLAERGWSGLAIEPAPSVFARLKALYGDNPAVRCVQSAVSDHVAPRGEMLISEGPDGAREEDRWQYSQVSTLNPWFAKKYVAHHDYRYRAVEVDVRLLTEILESLDCPADPGFLCTDCEGEDYWILRALNFSRFQPRLLGVECNDVRRPAFSEFLVRHGYRQYGQTAVNTFFALQDPA